MIKYFSLMGRSGSQKSKRSASPNSKRSCIYFALDTSPVKCNAFEEDFEDRSSTHFV